MPSGFRTNWIGSHRETKMVEREREVTESSFLRKHYLLQNHVTAYQNV